MVSRPANRIARLVSRQRGRLAGEDGFALILALGTMVVLSVAVTTLIYYSSSSARTSRYQGSRQNAYALAEAGIAGALSQLSAALNPTVAAALPVCTAPSSGSASTGTFTYCGALTGSTWVISATGIVRNPTGASSIRRTLTRTVSITGSTSGTVGTWNRIYSDATGNCSFDVPKGVPVQGSLGVRGDLCLTGAAVTGNTSVVQVGGKVTLNPDNGDVNDARFPLAPTSASWTNPGNISANDNVAATQVVAAGATGSSIHATGAAFALPDNAVVKGIAVKIHRNASANNLLQSASIRLLKGGVPVGNDAATATPWGTGYSDDNLGANNDLWGSTWTAGDINNALFGVRISVKNVGASAATAGIDYVQFTVTYSLDASIGASWNPVQEADVFSSCKWSSGSANLPCSATDHVFASTISSPPALKMPTLDWAYWYQNAAPGPKHGCDTQSGTPPTFDNNGAYDASTPEQDVVPEGAGKSYTCIAKDAAGNTIGELSWNVATRVLTVSGTIFFDGDAKFHHDAAIVHYQGRATMFIAHKSELTEVLCAGGSGATTCDTTAGISNWDPSQNLLVLAIGDKNSGDDIDFHTNVAAFQGTLYGKNRCHIHDSANMSGPAICGSFQLDGSGPGLYAWPPITSLLTGQSKADPATATAFSMTLGNQSG